MRSKPLKEMAEHLRGLATTAVAAPESTSTPVEKLDSAQVLNFIKFFGGNHKGEQDG